MTAAFFKMSFSSLRLAIFASQAAQLVRCGLLASGSRPCAPELRRLRALPHPPVEDALADLEISGHIGHRFSHTHKADGLGFELCGISFSGHCIHGRLFPYFVVQKSSRTSKGFDLLKEALPRAIENMVFQFVVLGTGDRRLEDFMRGLTRAYPGRVGDYIGFSDELSHLIEAGSDFFLMPSLYEPCGLNQMYSMKYGTLPIVRATGGLDDSVQNYDESSGAGTGFKFWEPTASALYYTIGWAVSTWFDRPRHIARLRQQALAQEFSWDISAGKYLEVYEHALRRKRS